MKHNMLFLTICILILGTVAAAGQTKPFTYTANNGYPAAASERQDVILTVTKGPNGYEVGGEMRWGDGDTCDIHGIYYPATGVLRASCNSYVIDARKVKGEDALQLQNPFAAIARRLGAKPPVRNAGGNNDPNKNGFSLSGTWKCDDGGTYTLTQSGSSLTWEARSPDDGATWDHTFTGQIDGNEIKGSFQDHGPGTVRNRGNLTFKIVSKDHLEKTHSEGSYGCSLLDRQKQN